MLIWRFFFINDEKMSKKYFKFFPLPNVFFLSFYDFFKNSWDKIENLFSLVKNHYPNILHNKRGITQKQQMSAISKSNLTCICQSIASFNISIHSDIHWEWDSVRKPKAAAARLPVLPLFIQRQETKSSCRWPTLSFYL